MEEKVQQVIEKLVLEANPDDTQGMAHFGINVDSALGIRIPVLRAMAKEIGQDHALALGLWESGIHEARILASMVDDPAQVTKEQANAWVVDFDSWDLCDQVTGNLFGKLPFTEELVYEWAQREEEFVRRASFALMAWTAVYWKKAPNEVFEGYLEVIKNSATDARNFVKKAVNWALRNIGKHNLYLHGKALETAREIEKIDDKTARWIAADAIKELLDPKKIARVKKIG